MGRHSLAPVRKPFCTYRKALAFTIAALAFLLLGFAVREAESQFMRRELGWTYCIDDRGPDRRPGILPEWRDRTTSEPDALAFKLEYYARFLAKQDGDKCRGMAKQLKSGTAIIRKITDNQMKEFRAKLEKIYKKKIILNEHTDPSVIGGVKVVCCGNMLDGTVRTRLHGMKDQIKENISR